MPVEPVAAVVRRPDGRQHRWDQHKAERRRLVVDAGLRTVEAAGPGEGVHVQQIADSAGLRRTVLYRHFTDRADLDRAIQAEIVDRVWGEIIPVLSLEGTPVQVTRRIVGAYVGWAAAHPALHRFVELDVPGEDPSPLEQMVTQLAYQIEVLITLGAELLEVPLDEDLRAALDPLVFGMVGAAMGAVRRWLARPELVPEPEVFIELVAQSTWQQVAGLAAARGATIDPDVPLHELLGGELAHRG